MTDASSWTTDREIEFLSGLGRWSELNAQRGELLRCYQMAMDWRVRWGRMDRLAIRDAVMEMMR